ncbi:unnamed protein product [Effrenium voratum]|nr:unnamed protein product [Effrenium voratum]
MPGGLLQSLLTQLDLHGDLPTIDSRVCRHRPQLADFLPNSTTLQRGSRRHFVSFKKKKEDANDCYCPALGHCVPGFQCPLGEHIDRSKCFHTVTVKYPADTDYLQCLKDKEEDPEKECELKILEEVKIKTGGWFFFGGEGHPVAHKVKGLAKEAGVKEGYELIAIDGNQADWREPGFKAYIKNLKWDPPAGGTPVELTPGDGCKHPPPPPPPKPPPGLPGRFPFSFQEVSQGASEGGEAEEAEEKKIEPCYPNGHSLTFKVSAPVWMFWIGPKTTCQAFRETCCSEGSTREGPEDMFAEACATKQMCKPQESCDQMPGRPGVCKYQVLELKGDYDDQQENEDKEDEAAKDVENEEQQQERKEEEQEAEDEGEEEPIDWGGGEDNQEEHHEDEGGGGKGGGKGR